MLSRRGFFAGFAALTPAVAVACTGRDQGGRLATENDEIAAPSGEFTAIIVADGSDLRPTIRDASGETVWTDDLAHVERYAPGVVWESDADVLWVLSTDHGNGSVRQGEGGAWVKTMGSEAMPADIADLAR